MDPITLLGMQCDGTAGTPDEVGGMSADDQG